MIFNLPFNKYIHNNTAPMPLSPMGLSTPANQITYSRRQVLGGCLASTLPGLLFGWSSEALADTNSDEYIQRMLDKVDTNHLFFKGIGRRICSGAYKKGDELKARMDRIFNAIGKRYFKVDKISPRQIIAFLNRYGGLITCNLRPGKKPRYFMSVIAGYSNFQWFFKIFTRKPYFVDDKNNPKNSIKLNVNHITQDEEGNPTTLLERMKKLWRRTKNSRRKGDMEIYMDFFRRRLNAKTYCELKGNCKTISSIENTVPQIHDQHKRNEMSKTDSNFNRITGEITEKITGGGVELNPSLNTT